MSQQYQRMPAPGGNGASAGSLTPTATKTTAYTAAVGDMAMMNVPAGATALTLPTAPADGKQVGYRAIGASDAVPLVVTAGAGDTIGLAGATSARIPLPDEITILQYQASGARWLGVSNVKTQASLGIATPLTVDAYLAAGTGHMAHRGSAKLHLENSVEAMELLADMGYKFIDGGDLWLSSGGAEMLAFHQSTLGTDITGPGTQVPPATAAPTAFTVNAWRQMKLSAAAALATGMPFDNIADAKPATLSDFCRIAKRANAIILPENKSSGNATAVAKMIEVIQRYGMTNQVIFCSFNAADLVAPKAAGMKTAWIASALPGGALATCLANGIDYFHYDYTNTGSFTVSAIQTLYDGGVKIAPWTFQRRAQIVAEAARVGRPLAWVASDYAPWTSGLYPPSTTDPFNSGTPYIGQISLTGSNAGRYTRQGKLSFINGGGAWQSWGSLDGVSPTNRAWTQKVTYETIPVASQNAGVYMMFGMSDDTVATFNTIPQGGYLLRVKPSGVVTIQRYIGSSSVSIGTFTLSSGAFTTPGQAVTMKFEFIGTSVKVTCIETGQSSTAVDTNYRGQHFAYGNDAADCEVSYSGVTIA